MNEYLARFNSFISNVFKLAENGPQSHQVGITKFVDMIQQKIARTYLNSNFNAFALINLKPVIIKIIDANPDPFDWRGKDFAFDVKDQGSCSSC